MVSSRCCCGGVTGISACTWNSRGPFLICESRYVQFCSLRRDMAYRRCVSCRCLRWRCAGPRHDDDLSLSTAGSLPPRPATRQARDQLPLAATLALLLRVRVRSMCPLDLVRRERTLNSTPPRTHTDTHATNHNAKQPRRHVRFEPSIAGQQQQEQQEQRPRRGSVTNLV